MFIYTYIYINTYVYPRKPAIGWAIEIRLVAGQAGLGQTPGEGDRKP